MCLRVVHGVCVRVCASEQGAEWSRVTQPVIMPNNGQLDIGGHCTPVVLLHTHSTMCAWYGRPAAQEHKS